jgi:hypothetical protein
MRINIEQNLIAGDFRSLGLVKADIEVTHRAEISEQDEEYPPTPTNEQGRRRSSIIEVGKALGLAILDKGSRTFSLSSSL